MHTGPAEPLQESILTGDQVLLIFLQSGFIHTTVWCQRSAHSWRHYCTTIQWLSLISSVWATVFHQAVWIDDSRFHFPKRIRFWNDLTSLSKSNSDQRKWCLPIHSAEITRAQRPGHIINKKSLKLLFFTIRTFQEVIKSFHEPNFTAHARKYNTKVVAFWLCFLDGTHLDIPLHKYVVCKMCYCCI